MYITVNLAWTVTHYKHLRLTESLNESGGPQCFTTVVSLHDHISGIFWPMFNFHLIQETNHCVKLKTVQNQKLVSANFGQHWIMVLGYTNDRNSM